MCTNNWPLLLDLSRDECKRILRRMELEAYSAVLTAFRAQGDLSKDKKGILQDLQNILSISTERHRAEVRRAVNDEKLTTIADNMAGPDVSSEWQIEGRRLIPLMPRLVPQTAFTVTANNAATLQAEKNLSLPPPGLTGSKEVLPTTPTTPGSGGPTAAPKSSRPTSPASNVVVLPSGMSIHIKGGLNTEEEDIQNKKRRRSSSTEGAIITKTHVTTPTVTSKALPSTAALPGPSNTGPGSVPGGGVSPMKITFTKSPAKPQTTTVTPSQKVILVSTTTHAGSSPTILQKSMAVPVIKTTTTTGGTVTTFTSPRASIIMPASMAASSVANGNLGNIFTVATSSTSGSTPSSAVTALTTANQTIMASSLNAVRPRTKMITTRPKTPMQMTPRGGMVMQMPGSHHLGGASPMAQGSQHGLHNIHVKPVHKPTIHIKHEGGMKIITQGMPTSASKILPKPPGGGGGGTGSPMVVMSSQPSITMVSKANTSLAGQMAAGRVLNITTQGGKVIASSSNRGTAANVVTVNPKTLQLTAIKGAGGTTVLTTSGRVATATGAKPNVIVVQKAQPKRVPGQPSPSITLPKAGPSNSPFEKKQDPTKHVSVQKTLVTKQLVSRAGGEPHIRRTQQPFAVKVRGDVGEAGRSSLLAELIQAVGIQPDGSGEVSTAGGDHDSTSGLHQGAPSAVHTVVVQQEEVTSSAPTHTTTKELSGNRWVEYDVPRGTSLTAGRDSSDTSAIKALLDLQTGAKQRLKPGHGDLPTATSLPQHKTYTIEHATTSRPMAGNQTTLSSAGGIHYTTARQQQVRVSEGTTSVMLEQPGGETVSVQLAGADLAQLTSLGQEIMGELDPETGIFYTTAPGGGETAVVVTTSTPQVTVPHSVGLTHTATAHTPTTAPTTHKPIDFLSSALTQAQIDLDPYQFIDEDEPAFTSKLTTPGPAAEPTPPPLPPPANPAPLMDILTAAAHSAQSQDVNLSAGVEVSLSSTVTPPTTTTTPATSLLPSATTSTTHTPTIHTHTPTSITTHTPTSISTHTPTSILVSTVVTAPPTTAPLRSLTVTEPPRKAAPAPAPPPQLPHLPLSVPEPVVQDQVSLSVLEPAVSTSVHGVSTSVHGVSASVHGVSTSVHGVSTSVHGVPTPGDDVPQVEHIEGEVLEEMVVSDGIIDFEQHEVCVPESNVTVAVEPGGLDTTTMVIEDFTSQQYITDTVPPAATADLITIEYQAAEAEEGPGSPTQGMHSSEGHLSSGGEGGESSGLSSPVRISQRKRRPPSMPDDSPPHGHGNMSSWVRHASSVLQKVCKYRGSRKEKGELNASAWFLAPVDPKEVPDYYDIIKKPMDFGTVRHKLETSQYVGWDDFHVDMLLIQENCRRYNPPGHEIRRDCDEVFTFYVAEYERCKDKWQKMHVQSPSPKRVRLDRSPLRT